MTFPSKTIPLARMFSCAVMGRRVENLRGTRFQLLSIGLAAGVALMEQARGIYTFYTHLKWIWAIALGYAMSITVHLLMNAAPFRP